MRLFFALLLSPAQTQSLAQTAREWAAPLGAQLVPPENLHLTLSFLGQVNEDQLSALRAGIAQVRKPPVAVALTAIDYWRKSQILCAVSDEGARFVAAEELARSVTDAARGAGISPDIKPFRPHVTLARKVSSASARAGEWPRPLPHPMQIHCDEFVLMDSKPGERGSIYSAVDSWVLDD